VFLISIEPIHLCKIIHCLQGGSFIYTDNDSVWEGD